MVADSDYFFFFSSRRRHTRYWRDWSSDVCSPISGTESQAAYDLLAERFPAQSGDTANVVFAVEDGTLRDGARAAAVERTVAEIARQPSVTSAVSPLSEEGAGQIGRAHV